jgi:hypothetical protein
VEAGVDTLVSDSVMTARGVRNEAMGGVSL